MIEDVDIVIITALDIERDSILNYLPESERIVNKNRIYYRSKLYDGGDEHLNIIVLSLPYMGNVNASIVTTQAIEVWNPRYIILTGIAGGLKSDNLRLGDLIVAEQIVYYESGKKLEDTLISRYLVQPSSIELLNYAHNYNSIDWFRKISVSPPVTNYEMPQIHFGVVASGEKVISDSQFGVDFKKIWPKAVAVEMEGYGAALAAFQSENRPGFLLIKSICDLADRLKDDKWQLFCAHIAASYTVNLLKNLIGSSFNWNKNRKQSLKIERKLYNGKSKICLCKDLLNDWYDLADYFEIPPYQRNRFRNGRECQEIWEWLEARGKLDGLEEALKFIGREDLLRCLGYIN